jgi:hypothetical protein
MRRGVETWPGFGLEREEGAEPVMYENSIAVFSQQICRWVRESLT